MRPPWPFAGGRFTEVLAYDVIEHCDDVVRIMEEIHRLSADGAIVRITVPHFSCANAYSDPTHIHCFGWRSFEFLTRDDPLSFYTPRRFLQRHRQIVFCPTLLNEIIWRLANRFPERYERRWAWLFPAWFVYYELEVVGGAA